MMKAARFTHEQRDGAWMECASVATKIKTIMMDQVKMESTYMKLDGYQAGSVEHLSTFGEVGIVANLEN